ncbi:MAG: chemotaxis protein CheX [Candidatus Krumholzibacteriia bacterium]
MTEQMRDAVQETFVEVVEKLTFMFGERAAIADVAVGTEPWAEARMSFTGDVKGSLAVIVPQELQPEIASNILGLDSELMARPEVLDDALREMLNVVCGHVIRTLAGPSCSFDLVTPENVVLSGADLQALLEDPDTSAYLLDDEPILMNLKFERS